MKLMTAQMAKWRKVPEGYVFIDTTIKSGEPMLAPTWDMVARHKAGTLTNDLYTEMYYDIMRNRYKQNYLWFNEFCGKEFVVISCYCKDGCFCHRYLLVDIIRKLCLSFGYPFEYLGEIT
ncbi:hypothetical protein [Proteus columbae]|uniref:DUF488 family protein, N3 subclade n=1 Tax=Proteus columbae TaxID=1987580 RepID=UPI0039067482